MTCLHYFSNAFAINYNIPVITDLQNPRATLGQRRGFSAIDIRQINKHYNCKGGGGTKPKPATPKPPTGGCRDTDSKCSGWVSRVPSYCKNHDYVKTHCRKACKLCGGGGGTGTGRF